MENQYSLQCLGGVLLFFCKQCTPYCMLLCVGCACTRKVRTCVCTVVRWFVIPPSACASEVYSDFMLF